MGVFSLSLQIGAMSEVDDAEANSFVQEFLSQTEDIDGLGIFQNNSLAAFYGIWICSTNIYGPWAS